MAHEKNGFGFKKFTIGPGDEMPKPVSCEGAGQEVSYPGAHHQRLFEHMYDEHGLILLCTELDEIVRIIEEEY